ncbi:hypothetical protein HY487_00755 [Candidatus Woesearchaeota archaeon]|nr:hypothetical protein [Candidatus Woesearchaeota archaeon]
MLELFGFKTVAFFDIWTIEHILSGISVGYAVKKQNRKGDEKNHSYKSLVRLDLAIILFLGYLWESLEHYLEDGIAGPSVQYWFQGVEAWPNRIISDPLMLVLGYYIAFKKPVLVIPARVLSVAWLFFHIFIFPNSMYLHYLLFK